MTPATGSAETLRRLDAVAQVALRLACSAPSGRVLLAQLALGLDDRLIPRPWGEELVAEMARARRATAEPISRAEVERALETAWGTRPADELDDLAPEPVAVTPTSQVHRATLDGRPVAVKVQRPGLARSVHRDLALLDSLVAPLTAALPQLAARAVLAEVGERVRDEFDTEHEAANARLLARRFRDHPDVRIPAPVMRLAGEDVLVREWVDGTPLDDPALAPATRDAAAAALVEFVAHGARTGYMNAGLTPADVLVTAERRVAIVDHGVCCAVDPDRLAHARDVAVALHRDDAERLARSFAALGWLTDRSLAAELSGLVRPLKDANADLGQTRLDVETARRAGERLLPHRESLTRLISAGALAPADLWPMRGLLQLGSTIARVGATVDLRAQANASTPVSAADSSHSRSA